MQQQIPEPLHCPQVGIKNLQVILPGSAIRWLCLESQAPNFWHNPVHSVKLWKIVSMRLTRSEVLILWIVILEVMRKGFLEGHTVFYTRVI